MFWRPWLSSQVPQSVKMHLLRPTHPHVVPIISQSLRLAAPQLLCPHPHHRSVQCNWLAGSLWTSVTCQISASTVKSRSGGKDETGLRDSSKPPWTGARTSSHCRGQCLPQGVNMHIRDPNPLVFSLSPTNVHIFQSLQRATPQLLNIRTYSVAVEPRIVPKTETPC